MFRRMLWLGFAVLRGLRQFVIQLSQNGLPVQPPLSTTVPSTWKKKAKQTKAECAETDFEPWKSGDRHSKGSSRKVHPESRHFFSGFPLVPTAHVQNHSLIFHLLELRKGAEPFISIYFKKAQNGKKGTEQSKQSEAGQLAIDMSQRSLPAIYIYI